MDHKSFLSVIVEDDFDAAAIDANLQSLFGKLQQSSSSSSSSNSSAAVPVFPTLNPAITTSAAAPGFPRLNPAITTSSVAAPAAFDPAAFYQAHLAAMSANATANKTKKGKKEKVVVVSFRPERGGGV